MATSISNPLSDRRVQAAHLLRRVGFGGTSAEIDQYAAMSHADAVNKLLNFVPNPQGNFNLERRMQEADYIPHLEDIQTWWVDTMLNTPNPLQEKMTLFWHGHFTSAYSKVDNPVLLVEQNQLFRANALGNFKDLTKAISRNPAMIYYLDGEANHKGAANENYARELMELFTIGIGNYTEQDVREAARAFTGWGLRGRAFYFNPNDHDSGSKTFMGQTGNFNGDDIIDIILKQPASGKFIVSELWNYFVYPNPDPSVINNLTQIYYNNNYELKPVLQAMLTSPEFLSAQAYRALVKSPTEFMVGSMRQLGITNIGPQVARGISAMGQVLFSPPTVKGWDGGITWFNSALFFNRTSGANSIAENRGSNDYFNPANLLKNATFNNSSDLVNHLLNTMLDGQYHPDIQSALLGYFDPNNSLTSNDLGTLANSTATSKNNKNSNALQIRLRGLVHLVMSTPEYQLS